MLRWLKRIFIFLLLLIYGRGQYEGFLEEVRRHCKKRRNRKHVPGITEELDELLELPDNCTDAVSFVGFTKDGQVASFRTTKADKFCTNISVDLPGVGRFSYNQSRSYQLGPGPLQLEVLAPMKRWKISFQGRVKRQLAGGEHELVHMSAFFYWQCLADPFDHIACLSTWELAGNLSDLAWDGKARSTFFSRESIRYEQWGEMRGRIELEGHESQLIRMKGFRKHSIERQGSRLDETLVSHHLIQDDGGYYITNGGVYRQNGLGERYGYLTVPIGKPQPTEQSSLTIAAGDTIDSKIGLKIQYPFEVTTKGRSLLLHNAMQKKATQFDGPDSLYSFTTCSINGKSAYGVTGQEPVTPCEINTSYASELKKAKPMTSCNKLTIGLADEESTMSELVGGKAAQLSMLQSLKYRVPKGFAVTTYALKQQMQNNPHLQAYADKITSDIRNKRLGTSVLDSCDDCVQTWKGHAVCSVVSNAIKNELMQMFGPDFEDVSFAVRSSGVSEDGQESSYAGQMETFLGIKGLENILLAVCNCWASSFSHRAVEYRHQNGQPVVEPMAVVIQEMVDAEVSGVLFTSDPVTGNTSNMVINAAPGLGETVVSGTCNPDTITVRRSKGKENFVITDKSIAEKMSKLVCSAGSGVIDVENEEKQRNAICLTDTQVQSICKLGAEVEEHRGCPQDIEWASSKGDIYLLQTRPITAGTLETDEDLLHEFDSPLATDKECSTICNIGEMFPGVASTLTQDIFVSLVNNACGKFAADNCGDVFPEFANKACLSFTNKPCLGFTAISAYLDCFMQEKAAYDISITGRELHEHSLELIQAFKGGPVSTFKSLKAFVNANFIQSSKHIKWFSEWADALNSFSLDKDDATVGELYSHIDDNLYLFFKAWRAYIYATTRSFIPYAVMYKLMQRQDPAFANDLNADMTVLLAGCPDLYTAGVPRSLQMLARNIAESNIKDAFMQNPDEKGHGYLAIAEESVRRRYEEFLDMHGHRCVNESELMVKSWKTDPGSLVHVLKLLIKSQATQELFPKESLSKREVVDSLQTPLSWFKKYLIREILLDKAKNGIVAREVAKSTVIKTCEAFRKGYWKLAHLMVEEGRLPEEKMLFFLTNIEIGTLLESRSAALVRKARRRMYIHRQMEAVRYPKLCYGLPSPLSQEMENASHAAVTAHGTAVGRGVRTGRACVIQTLADADGIQAGDILICPLTDIGWTPYFAMISGLVTEMGGLISHGAVVAREVGIPCVVNLTNATQIFNTGDRVRIDGLAGVVQRLVD